MFQFVYVLLSIHVSLEKSIMFTLFLGLRHLSIHSLEDNSEINKTGLAT